MIGGSLDVGEEGAEEGERGELLCGSSAAAQLPWASRLSAANTATLLQRDS